MNENIFSFLIIMTAFAFFIVCPRMAAMTNLITKQTKFSIYLIVIIGTIVSIPLLLLMTFVIKHWGLTAGLGLAILTDFLAALVMSSVSMKAAIETFIIALFVVAGNKIAVWLSSRFF